MQAKLKNNIIEIEFRYDPAIVQNMRTLESRRWNSISKRWECAPFKENVQKLKQWGFEIDQEIQKLFLPRERPKPTPIKVQGLKKNLYPFQEEGVGFIESKKGRVLIGDEMGLGKTAQSLAWLQLHPEVRPVIIVCPSSLKLNWRNEINTWMSSNKKIYIIEGKKEIKLPKADIYIINYDILFSHVNALLSLNPEVLITDESHFYKSRKANRTKAIQYLGKNIKHIIALTGTPIINRPFEIFNAISLVRPSLFPNFFSFARRYCNARKTRWGWDFNGASKTEELHDLLTSACMIRRTKKDVLSDLPSKIRSIIPLQIDNEDEYSYVENDFSNWVKENKGRTISSAEALTQIEYLKQICIKGKMKQIIEWIKDYLEQENKLVVMATHRKTIETLANHFGKQNIGWAKVIGGMSSEEKECSVQEFQNNPNVRLFLGNIEAAGIGITLTSAKAIAIIELDWTPGVHDQAEDRIHRIGQKETCNIYYFIGENTIEEKILKLIDSKRETISAVLDRKEVDEESLLSKLLSEYYEGREQDDNRKTE